MPSDIHVAPSRLMNKPTWLIGQISIQAHRLLTDALASVNSRGYHYRLLAALEEFGPTSQAMLGRRTEMDRSNVATSLDELAERGLVRRTADPQDSRRNIITITPNGRAQLERLDDVLTEVQSELLRPLSQPERRTLVDLLARVLAHHTAS